MRPPWRRSQSLIFSRPPRWRGLYQKHQAKIRKCFCRHRQSEGSVRRRVSSQRRIPLRRIRSRSLTTWIPAGDSLESLARVSQNSQSFATTMSVCAPTSFCQSRTIFSWLSCSWRRSNSVNLARTTALSSRSLSLFPLLHSSQAVTKLKISDGPSFQTG